MNDFVIMAPPGPDTFYNGRRAPLAGMAVPIVERDALKSMGWRDVVASNEAQPNSIDDLVEPAQLAPADEED